VFQQSRRRLIGALVLVSGLPFASLAVSGGLVLVLMVAERLSTSSVTTWQNTASVRMFTGLNIPGSSGPQRSPTVSKGEWVGRQDYAGSRSNLRRRICEEMNCPAQGVLPLPQMAPATVLLDMLAIELAFEQPSRSAA
jgi:hypothetical protein